MGCQRKIAQQILDQEGTYVLVLKENQGGLHDEVQLSFATAQAEDFADVHHDAATTERARTHRDAARQGD